MKKKKNPIVIAILILIIILAVIIYLYVAPTGTTNIVNNQKNEESIENISTAKVSTQTIENTLSSSGQISSALTEKMYLHASYYFEEMLVEENVFVAEGENIIEYTNGTYLTAPYDCVVLSSELPTEDEICTTSHYVEISSIDALAMSLDISESEINKVQIGDEVNITITATNEEIIGYITEISEVGTYSSSGSYFSAIVEFENNGNLKIGMSATCKIIIEKVENVIAVPVEAIQTSDEGKYVIVVKSNGSTENVNVETGTANDAYIEIKSGLSGNETVQINEESESSSTGSKGRQNMGGDFPGGNSGGMQMQMPEGGMQMPKM